MNRVQLLHRGRVWQRALQLTAASLAIAGTGAVSGCLSRPLQTEDTRTTSTVVTRLPESSVEKIDLLLMIDNSRSMADKQQILVQAVPDLVRGLVNPRCVDPDNPEDASKWSNPAGPLEACPAGRKRDFKPVVDIHVGIVSSSIGGHGAESCPDEESSSGGCPAGMVNRTNNDHGHLITRLNACSGAPATTYQGKGFLAWDPKQQLKDAQGNPAPGEKDIGEIATMTNPDGTVDTKVPGLVPSLKDLVLGTGQVGCGFEASHESWYRFLIDPDPYKTITIGADGKASPQSVDDVLLQQRKDFLRPGSLLAIIGLTDENDCSIKEYGQFWLAAKLANPNNTAYYLPKARSECATNPNDKCCVSTGQKAPDGCPPEPQVDHGPQTDPANLRCFDQKRRFGIDFLYPIDRYVNGLTNAQVPNRQGELVPNPIFSDLDPTDKDFGIRDTGLVFLAYITGVPWQDIARRDANGKPDLLGGLNGDMKPVGGFKSAAELSLPIDDQGHTGWDLIIGDPSAYVPPLDPHMIESTSARMGTNPITGDQIAPENSPAGTDAINGHEYTPGTKDGVQIVADDVQYACIFELPQPRDCSPGSGNVSCDCADPKNNNPLCEPQDPNDPTSPRYKQVRAKAYPGIRELSLIKGLGNQGIVGSICPRQLDKPQDADYGYRPAVGAIIDRLKVALGGQCLPRKLKPDEKTGLVQCLVLEALRTNGTHEKDCDSFCDGLTARQRVSEDHKPAVEKAQEDPIAKNAGWDCFCEIKQLDNGKVDDKGKDIDPNDDFLNACQNDPSEPPSLNGQPVDGWCYVDATTTPPLGDSKIVAKCPATEKRQVRFVGAGNPQEGSTLFITCAGE